MAISSINIKASSSNAFTHNDRTLSPSYLLDKKDSLGIECNRTSQQAQELYLSLRNEAFGNYTLRTGQKVQTKEEKLRWSAVVNLNENHTLKDVEQLADTLSKKYGWQVLQVAIHRDEGFVKDGKPQYNLHAHIELFMLDKEGLFTFKKREFGAKKMSELQDIVSSELSMQRGVSKLESKRERLEHREYKQQARAIEQAVKKVKETYNFREYQAKITALETDNAELKKELHKLNTAVNKGKADVEVLELRLSEAKQTTEKVLKSTSKLFKSVTFDNQQAPTDTSFFDYVAEEREMLKEKLAAAELRAAQLDENREKVQNLKKDLSQALESKKELSEVNHTLRIEKMDLKGNQSVLNKQVEELKNENEVLKTENEKLSWYKKQYQAIVSSLKTWTKLDDIKAVMQNLKERFEAPKSNEQDYQKHFRGWCNSTNFFTKEKLLEELNTSSNQALINTLLVTHQVPAVLIQDPEKFKQKLEAQVQSEKDHMTEITSRIQKENAEFKKMFSQAKQKGPDLTR